MGRIAMQKTIVVLLLVLVPVFAKYHSKALLEEENELRAAVAKLLKDTEEDGLLSLLTGTSAAEKKSQAITTEITRTCAHDENPRCCVLAAKIVLCSGPDEIAKHLAKEMGHHVVLDVAIHSAIHVMEHGVAWAGSQMAAAGLASHAAVHAVEGGVAIGAGAAAVVLPILSLVAASALAGQALGKKLWQAEVDCPQAL